MRIIFNDKWLIHSNNFVILQAVSLGFESITVLQWLLLLLFLSVTEIVLKCNRHLFFNLLLTFHLCL